MNRCKCNSTGVRRGLALVEMTLVMFILTYITLGAVEYSWLFLKQEQVANAARQAARLAATPGATNTAVTNLITTLMSGYGLSGKYNTPVFTPSDVSTATTGSTVSVNISLSYGTISITKNATLLPMPSTMSATVTMEKEGS